MNCPLLTPSRFRQPVFLRRQRRAWRTAGLSRAASTCRFVIGSSLAGYAYLVANVALHVPISLLWWFWSVGFDGTHIFGTASRTFFDSEARHSRRALLFGSAAFFFALGPAMVLLGGKAVLAMIVAVWAYYHVIRQHYGIMVLYKVKNRDLAKLDNTLDRWFLGVMTVFPAVPPLLHSPSGGIGTALLVSASGAVPVGAGGRHRARICRRGSSCASGAAIP